MYKEFCTENVLFGYFQAKTLRKNSCHQSRICQNAMFLTKQKHFKFVTKNVLFECF